MLRPPVSLPLGPEGGHGGVDGLERVDVQFLLHLLEEVGQEEAAGGGVVGGPVVLEGGQAQVLGHHVQLELAQLRQKVLGQDQGVDVGGVEVQPSLLAPGADEADVELRVVGGEGPVPCEVQEGPQGLLRLWRALEHLIGDAGEVCDLHGQRPARVHEGLEALTHLTVLDDHRADLGDGLILDVQAGGLDVKGYVFVGKGPLHAAMDGDAVV